MKKRGSGVIINDIGNSGENWDYNYVAGSTGNAAVMSFTKAVGGVSLDFGVRVVGVNPGPIATDRMVRIMKRRAPRQSRRREPLAGIPDRLSRRPHGHRPGSRRPDRLSSPRRAQATSPEPSSRSTAASPDMARSSSRDRSGNERLRAAQRALRPSLRHQESALARPEHQSLADASGGPKGAAAIRLKREEFHAYAPPGGFTALTHGDPRRPRPAEGHDRRRWSPTARSRRSATVCRTLCEPGTNFVTTDPGWKWPMQFAAAGGRRDTRKSRSTGPSRATGFGRSNSPTPSMRKTRIIYLVDPNNPLGSLLHAPTRSANSARVAAELPAPTSCTTARTAISPTITSLAATFYPEARDDDLQLLEMAGSRRAACWRGGCEQDADRTGWRASPPPRSAAASLRSAPPWQGLRLRQEWMPQVQSVQRRNQTAIKEAVDKIAGLFISGLSVAAAISVMIECAELGCDPKRLPPCLPNEGS